MKVSKTFREGKNEGIVSTESNVNSVVRVQNLKRKGLDNF